MTLYEGIRSACDQKISDCRELIRANANFLPDVERNAELLLLEVFKRPTNITEAVRLALALAMARQQGLTPTQIKEHIEARGFSLSEYTNPLASIHTILRRMKEADPPEVEYDEQNDTYKAVNYPTSSELIGDGFNKKLFQNVMLRMVKFDKDQAAAVISEETQQMIVKAVERRRRAED